jgi:hypothetical protein
MARAEAQKPGMAIYGAVDRYAAQRQGAFVTKSLALSLRARLFV